MSFQKVLCTSVIVLTIVCLAMFAHAAQKIQAATWLPPNHFASKSLYTYWAERVNAYSQGELDVRVDLGSAMLTPRGAMSSLSSGVVDVAFHTGQYTPSELNVSAAVEELAMLHTDPFIMIAAVADFDLNHPMMQEQWHRNKVVYGGPYITSPYVLLCNKEITTLEQIAGKKIRLPGRAPGAWASEAGAVPVSMSSNEMYSALDKGAIDCTTAIPVDLLNRKLFEVAKHLTNLPITIFWAGYGWAYNPDFWQGLTEKQRRALFNAQADAIAHFMVNGIIKGDKAAAEQLKANNVQFHQPGPKLTASLNRFKDKQRKEAETIAKNKFRIQKPGDLYADFGKTVAKWADLLKDMPRKDEAAFSAILKKEIYDKIDLSKYGTD